MNYYISDPHFYHYNIIKYDNRPFRTTTEMNETIIKNWQERVRPEDMIRCGKYKHFKGNEYIVMDIGYHTETSEEW